MCDNGCKMMPAANGSNVGVGLGSNPSFYTYGTSGWAATGGVCTKNDTGEISDDTGGGNDGQQCVKQDNLTQCQKPDGRHCAVASSGKEFCWEPTEHGIKTSGNEAASKVPAGKDAKPPPVPPKNGGEWEKIAESLVTISEKVGGTTNTTNSTVNNYTSSYGSQGSGAAGNGGAGQGNGGSGDGSGSGSGNGNGGGDGDGDGDGPGGTGEGVGDLYSKSDKTVASVFATFKTRVAESPLIAAVQDFFTVSVGGSCPTFTVPASAYWQSMTYDGHCSGNFLAALRAIGWVLMAVAALAAAYWALS